MIITERQPWVKEDWRGWQFVGRRLATYRLSDYTMTQQQADAHVQLGGDVAAIVNRCIAVVYGSGVGPYGDVWQGAEWRVIFEVTYEDECDEQLSNQVGQGAAGR